MAERQESGRREPEVHEVGEGGWIVRHTHDIDLAAGLLHAHLAKEGWNDDVADAARCWPVAEARQIWTRVIPALPNSWAAGEGYRFYYHPAEPHERGAFRAVEWWHWPGEVTATV